MCGPSALDDRGPQWLAVAPRLPPAVSRSQLESFSAAGREAQTDPQLSARQCGRSERQRAVEAELELEMSRVALLQLHHIGESHLWPQRDLALIWQPHVELRAQQQRVGRAPAGSITVRPATTLRARTATTWAARAAFDTPTPFVCSRGLLEHAPESRRGRLC
jgi:hypothetical protein